MKIRRSITATAAAVVLGGTGALVLPAVANAHNASTTLKFTATEIKDVSFTTNSYGYQETDTDSTGATIGFDDVYFTNQTCCSASANVAFDINGGLLYGRFATNGGTTFSGKVTGGSGAFKGVTGTITGTTNGTNTKMKFTIVYS